MNFITEKLCFTRFKRSHHLSTGEIVLWDALFMASNSVGLGKKFTISDKLLCVDCSMSQNGISNARKGLINAGLLICSPYRPGEQRTYQLKSMEQIMNSHFHSQNFLSDTNCVNSDVSFAVNDSVSDSVTETGSDIINKKREKEKQYKTKGTRINQFNRCSFEEEMGEDDILALEIQHKRMREMFEKERDQTAPSESDSCNNAINSSPVMVSCS